jgi:hypothetical protein
LKHLASPDFWAAFDTLPARTRELARKNFELLKSDPRHPSLHLKKIGRYRSVRVGLRYRALGVEIETGILWFWIGAHADYDDLLKRN